MIFSFKHQFPHLAPIWEKYTAMQHHRTFPARTVLLKEGKIAENYYFIEQGCLRLWFDNKEKDTTVQFFFENEGVSSLESFQHNIPSIFSIETIEPTTVHVLPRELFAQMIRELEGNPEFMKVLLEITLQRQRHYMNEFLSRIRDTPQQRYTNLLKEKPHIIQRVPQHYIASYLGITSVHLSRIKNKLAKKG
jgi:CRP-like cAMP-binding protein